jgi:hypothetical protein
LSKSTSCSCSCTGASAGKCAGVLLATDLVRILQLSAVPHLLLPYDCFLLRFVQEDHPDTVKVHDKSVDSGDGILSIWLGQVAASEREPQQQRASLEDTDTDTTATAPAHHSSQEISKLWSVTGSKVNAINNDHGQCSNAQIENCLVQTALDAPSKTYDPAADVFHAADTYDCLVSTIGCFDRSVKSS